MRVNLTRMCVSAPNGSGVKPSNRINHKQDLTQKRHFYMFEACFLKTYGMAKGSTEVFTSNSETQKPWLRSEISNFHEPWVCHVYFSLHARGEIKCSQFPVKTGMKGSTETSFSPFSGVAPLYRSGSLCHLTAVWSRHKSAIFAFQKSSPTPCLFLKIWPFSQPLSVHPLRKKWLKLAAWFSQAFSVWGVSVHLLWQGDGWWTALGGGEQGGVGECEKLGGVGSGGQAPVQTCWGAISPEKQGLANLRHPSLKSKWQKVTEREIRQSICQRQKKGGG